MQGNAYVWQCMAGGLLKHGMNARQILAGLALVLAVCSAFVTALAAYPVIQAAVALLAIAMLV